MGSSINMMVYFVIIHCLLTSKIANGAIGLNWGRNNAQRLLPSTVVDLLLQNNVPQARIYTSQEDILKAFCGTGINLTVSIFSIKEFATKAGANYWVIQNGPFFGPASIRQVYIGNYMYDESNAKRSIKSFQNHINAMKSIQSALDKYEYGNVVKTNIPIPMDMLKTKITRPSEAEFRDEIKPLMNETLHYLAARGIPLVVQLFPILFMKLNKMDLEFAFKSNWSRHSVREGGAVYNNVFEFMYDSFVWAVEKVGGPKNMTVVVGQVGWPTDGFPGANVSTAERFYKVLLPFVTGNKGTPKRYGQSIDTYLHSVTDEPKNVVSNYNSFARHWGIFRSNGEPKFKIDLSGKGRDIYPTRARGIQRMPHRWCMYNENKGNNNMAKVQEQVEKACKFADCTATFPGGSCSELSFELNVSYAFNMYFQSMFQEEGACWFEGLAHVADNDDPSSGTCVFPIEVVEGVQKQFVPNSAGERLHDHGLPGSHALMFFFVLLSSFLWVL